MATFRYRAATTAGQLKTGHIEGGSTADVIGALQRQGLRPIHMAEVAASANGPAKAKVGKASRQIIAKAIGELGVLLGAGLTLDRALAIVVDNIGPGAEHAALSEVHKRVKEGVPLSRAMAVAPKLFPPMTAAMAEAGEANGKLAPALAKLAETLERSESLRQTIVSALIYPAMLFAIAGGVILMMLLVVVPQFEGLFSVDAAQLPATTRLVLSASHGLRDHGPFGLVVLVLFAVLVRQWIKRPAVRKVVHKRLLSLPQIGPLLTRMEIARFARVLGSLVEGGVPLPTALGIAHRSIVNGHMADAVGKVATGLKEGGGLTAPLAATGLFPRMALSFLRTGEETAQLGLMLDRLSDALDREIRVALARIIALLTPAITVVMGVIIATVIASIMSAILGFNDLALT